MTTKYQIVRSDGVNSVTIVSGLPADDASLTIIDAPPSAISYTYTLKIISDTISTSAFPDTRAFSSISALLVKK